MIVSSSVPYLHIARTMYNLAAVKLCKGEYNDPYVSTCLNDAKSIFRRLTEEEQAHYQHRHSQHSQHPHFKRNFYVEIGYCSYYEEYLQYKQSLDIAVRNSNNNIKVAGEPILAEVYNLCTDDKELKYALRFIDETLNKNDWTDNSRDDDTLFDYEEGYTSMNTMGVNGTSAAVGPQSSSSSLSLHHEQQRQHQQDDNSSCVIQ